MVEHDADTVFHGSGNKSKSACVSTKIRHVFAFINLCVFIYYVVESLAVFIARFHCKRITWVKF